MSPRDRLTAWGAALAFGLRREVDGWWIHRSDAGFWLAVRGATCIRAGDAAQLRERLRRYLAMTAENVGGGRS